MAVKHLTYLDLTPEHRARSASEARVRLRALMANPFRTPEQTAHLQNEMAKLSAWERGELLVPDVKAG